MEVKTGAIKAIANLTRNKLDSSEYNESLNYAIGFATERICTFKLATVLAAMDDYNVGPEKNLCGQWHRRIFRTWDERLAHAEKRLC